LGRTWPVGEGGASVNYNRYREIRELKNVGVRQLAALVDISPTYISQVETGKEPRGYSSETTMKLIVALNLSRDEAKEMLAEWRDFYASALARIDQFVENIEPAGVEL